MIIYLLLLMTSRFANDVMLIQVLQKKLPYEKLHFHSNYFTR